LRKPLLSWERTCKGNLSAAQKDFTTIQQDLKKASTNGSLQQQGSEISQLLAQLESALKSGNLSNANSAYSSLAQLFQQSGQVAPANGSASLSVTA
jgi:hypothetical protein